ncbi:hypothetical protein GCM10020218_092460 [Dactylosporangium vinaceum]
MEQEYSMEVRHATSPDEVDRMGTEELRGRFLVPGLVGGAMVRLVYSHHDRLVVGGVTPGTESVALPNPGALRSAYFLERRELGVVNVGTATGRITVDGEVFELGPKECLYAGRGARDVAFAGHGASFYLVSTPAHAVFPSCIMASGTRPSPASSRARRRCALTSPASAGGRSTSTASALRLRRTSQSL